MSTTDTTDNTTIDPDAFDDLIRSALRDDLVWDDIVATHQGVVEAEHWLRTTIASIDQQLSFRADDMGERRLTGDPASVEELIEYHRWRKSAVYLKRLCEQRSADLRKIRSADQSRADRIRNVLIELANAVLDHEDELTSDRELHNALDEIQMPGPNSISLRQLAESMSPQTDIDAA